MIIDCHRHVWPNPSHLEDGSLGGAAALAEWQENGWPSPVDENDAPIRGMVACSIILGFKSNLLGAAIPNEFVSQYVSQHADCTVGLAGVDPTDRKTPAEVAAHVRRQGEILGRGSGFVFQQVHNVMAVVPPAKRAPTTASAIAANPGSQQSVSNAGRRSASSASRVKVSVCCLAIFGSARLRSMPKMSSRHPHSISPCGTHHRPIECQSVCTTWYQRPIYFYSIILRFSCGH